MARKYKSNQMLWRVSHALDGYWYEIKLDGVVIDRVPVKKESLLYFQEEGVI